MGMDLRDRLAEGTYKNECVYSLKDDYLYRVFKLNEQRINAQFQEDALAYLREAGVPEKMLSKVYYKAWDDGHAYGYAKIINKLEELAELFR